LDLLLFSNSTNHGMKFLEHASTEVSAFLDGVDELLFIPFAGADHDGYTELVAKSFAAQGIKVTGLHTYSVESAGKAINSAQAIFTGGGNTFRLTRALYQRDVLQTLREAVLGGTKYMGASAGTNIAAPTLRTTNDMPIVEPTIFNTLGVIPFQINAHYLDSDPFSTHAGETRETRLREFLEDNDTAVLGLREGTHIRVTPSAEPNHHTVNIGGKAASTTASGPAMLFQRGKQPTEVDGDMTFLLDLQATFDA
jgi:dipeptidase E